VLDGAVFASGIHGLKNNQQSVVVLGIENILVVGNSLDVGV
jgi:hypothetical protein